MAIVGLNVILKSFTPFQSSIIPFQSSQIPLIWDSVPHVTKPIKVFL